MWIPTGISGASAVACVVVALAGIYWFILRSDAPDPVSLDEAVAAATSTTEAAATRTSAGTADPPPLSGDWTIVSGDRSFAGYRVEEELARIGVTEAAGRTGDVVGSLRIGGTTVTVVEIVVNMQTLRSDDDRRDRQMRTQGLETVSFPRASFTLAEPIDLPDAAVLGDQFTATAVGDLELHGVTNRIELELQAQLVEGIIAGVGSAEIEFADYDIDPPTALVLRSVDDKGLMGFPLLFERV